MEVLFDAREADVESVVLYGSMARGDWSRHSDFDVLVGLESDPQPRFIDRLGTFLDLSRTGDVEALPYTLPQVERMFTHLNLVILAALRDGIVLYDRGMWRRYQERFQTLLARRLLIPEPRGWSWTEEAERVLLQGHLAENELDTLSRGA